MRRFRKQSSHNIRLDDLKAERDLSHDRFVDMLLGDGGFNFKQDEERIMWKFYPENGPELELAVNDETSLVKSIHLRLRQEKSELTYRILPREGTSP